MNKRRNAAVRKQRHTAQKVKARKKGIDTAGDGTWNVGTWEERRSRSWRSQRSTGESAAAPKERTTTRRPRTAR